MWRPIETAPKDGTPVDLWAVFENGDGCRYTDCRWTMVREMGRDLGEAWAEFDGYLGEMVQIESKSAWGSCTATHWMPLPDPPR